MWCLRAQYARGVDPAILVKKYYPGYHLDQTNAVVHDEWTEVQTRNLEHFSWRFQNLLVNSASSRELALIRGCVVSIELFEEISLYLGLGGLILLMAYIVWDLAKKSNAGKFGTFILFLVLGLGVLGFLIKGIISHLMGV